MSAMQSLWPEAIKQKVLQPYTILRRQADLLGQVTHGVLKGVVETERDGGTVQHRLVVVAPSWNGYRETLLTLIHSAALPYPTEVQASALKDFQAYRGTNGNFVDFPIAAGEEELEAEIEKALKSPETRSLLVSLIANCTDAIDDSNR